MKPTIGAIANTARSLGCITGACYTSAIQNGSRCKPQTKCGHGKATIIRIAMLASPFLGDSRLSWSVQGPGFESPSFCRPLVSHENLHGVGKTWPLQVTHPNEKSPKDKFCNGISAQVPSGFPWGKKGHALFWLVEFKGNLSQQQKKEIRKNRTPLDNFG